MVEVGAGTPAQSSQEEIQARLSGQEGIAVAWIVVPHFLFADPIMTDIEALALPGFDLQQVTNGRGCQIRKYQRIR